MYFAFIIELKNMESKNKVRVWCFDKKVSKWIIQGVLVSE